MWMQSTGQGATHRPQPVHSSAITVCIIEELTTSQWKAKSPANVVSMRDGERFAYVSDNKKQIIVDYYKSSKPEVIFDVDKVEKSPVTTQIGRASCRERV